MRYVGVFPAGEDHAAVIEHGGTPVLVLIETQLADAGTVGLHDAQVGHRVAAAHTGHAMKSEGRTENDPAVGQVAGIEVIHVGLVAGRDLAQPGAVGLEFPDLPAVMQAGHREKQLVGVEIELEIAHEFAVLGFQEGGQVPLRADGRKHRDLVVVVVLGERTVGLPVLRQAHAAGAAFYQQEFIEVQQRIGQQDLALQSFELPGQVREALPGALIAAVSGRLGRANALRQLIQPAEQLRAARVLAGLGGDLVRERRVRPRQTAQRGEILEALGGLRAGQGVEDRLLLGRRRRHGGRRQQDPRQPEHRKNTPRTITVSRHIKVPEIIGATMAW